jgi:hypothetical protein
MSAVGVLETVAAAAMTEDHMTSAARPSGGGPVRIPACNLSDPERGVRGTGESRPQEAAGTRSDIMQFFVTLTVDQLTASPAKLQSAMTEFVEHELQAGSFVITGGLAPTGRR